MSSRFYNRPSAGYTGEAGLTNRTKYNDDSTASPRRPISSVKVDGDINYLIDAVNALYDTAVSGIVADKSITNAKLRDSAALSVIGRSANTSGSPADLAAANDGEVLRRSGTSLGFGTIATAGIADGAVTAIKINSDAGVVPAGGLVPFAGVAAPSGWLFCFGQAVSRTTFAALFATISTTYGTGDGSTTFNLPDLRGRSIFGRDDMGGTSANRLTTAGGGIDGDVLGAAGGSEFMHQHNHGITDPGHTHTYNRGTGGSSGSNLFHRDDAIQGSGTVTIETTGITVNNAGTGTSQNIPPAIILNWIIKT